MKKNRIRRRLFFCGVFGMLLLCIFVGLAAVGKLSDDTRGKNRNVFGGLGLVHRFPAGHSDPLPMFYDDTTIYFVRSENKPVLYAYDSVSGKIRTVCTRVLCEHDNPDCSLHFLYDTTFLNYWVIDDAFYYSTGDEETIELLRLDVFTGKGTPVYSFPAYQVLTDEAGAEMKVRLAVLELERVNEDTVLLKYGDEVYLFDNHFSLKKKLYCGAGTGFTWSEDYILWHWGEDVACYSLKEDKLIQNLLSTATGKRIILSSSHFHYYKDRIYFTTGNKLMVYDFTEQTMEELREIVFPVRAFLVGTELFYHTGTMVEGIDFETGERKEYPFLKSVPKAKPGQYFIENNLLELRIHSEDGRRIYP